MRIHTKLSAEDLYDAAERAAVGFISLTTHGSRSADHAFKVLLTGSSPFRAQADSDYYAATWDEWGIFLAELFRRDPQAHTTEYRDGEHFREVTGERFDTLTVAQQHRRHRWDYDPNAKQHVCACGALLPVR